MKKFIPLGALAVALVTVFFAACAPFLFPVVPGQYLNPKIVARMAEGVSVDALDLEGNHLFLAQGDNGFAIYDITNSTNPSLLSSKKIGDLRVSSLMVYGNVLYLGTGTTALGTGSPYRFMTYNITNPSNPQKLGQLILSGPVFAIDAWGPDCYINESGIYSVELIDISNPAKPEIMAYREGGSSDLVVYQDYIFSAGDSLCVWKKADRDSIELIGAVPIGKDITGKSIAIGYGYAYVSTTTGLKVFSLKNLRKPTEVYNFKIKGESYGIKLADNNLFVTNSAGLFIFSVSNPKAPRLLAQLNMGGVPFDVEVKGNFAYVATDSGVAIVKLK